MLTYFTICRLVSSPRLVCEKQLLLGLDGNLTSAGTREERPRMALGRQVHESLREGWRKRLQGGGENQNTRTEIRDRTLPERSWRTAHSASGSPTRAPRRSEAGTRTRCSAPRRPAPGPASIWQVSWKTVPAFLLINLECLSVKTACWGAATSLAELTGPEFSSSLWIPWLLLVFLPFLLYLSLLY